MQLLKTKTVLFLWLLAILVIPQRSTEADDGSQIPADAKSVLVTPILPAVNPQRRARAQARDSKPLNAEKVRKSIQLGIQYLKELQKADGSWSDTHFEGATTALCTLALLNSEDLPIDPYKNSPHIKNALDYISGVPTSVTYFVSLRIMAKAAADPKGKFYLRDIKSDVDWLLKTQKTEAGTIGAWNYGFRGGQGDSSNSQFALLALHEASRLGIKIPKENWEMAKQYWTDVHRKKPGGFTYSVRDRSPSGSMTCAGISSWIIVNENLADAKALVNGQYANCCQPDDAVAKIDAAFGWLAKNYTVQANPGPRGDKITTRLYYLYGLERAGRLAGRRFVGANDWYRDGAKQLLKWQHPSAGYWKTPNGLGEKDPLVATSLALLFLSKGKRPVAIGKYNHGAADWDLHPKGVHYLTRRLESEWNQKLNWQTVRAENATVDDLLETPVLFMSGKDAIDMSQTQKETLKLYLENGGFLFAEACQGDGCGETAQYDRAFRELMAEIFPDSNLEALQLNHPIWNSHFPLVANQERPLLGLQACCRTSVVYCPRNLSCYWNLDRPSIKDDDSIDNRLKQRAQYCSRLGVNVISYATDRTKLKDKGDTPKLLEKKHEMLADRVLVFPKLLHDGGADDAPNAWRNVLRNVDSFGLGINMEKKMISATTEDLADHPFIFIHGRSRFSFTDQQREALRKHLEYGGFILADSICASEEFTTSFRREMQVILGIQLGPIDPGHEIWTNPRFGYQIESVTLRTKKQDSPGGFREQVTRPELVGAEVNGRLAVVFSPYDLSCALENSGRSQCNGYSRDDAIRICSNAIMYSLLSDTK